MAGPRTALYAAGITCLGFICFALASTAIGLPVWGYFDNPLGGFDADRGYFGPWRVCKQLSYNREKCGSDVSRFRPSLAIYISGILASISSASLGFFSILSVLQIAMISSREKICIKYNVLVAIKLALSLVAAILAIVSAVLFAVQIDETTTRGFRITRGVSFYLQILVIVLTIGLFVMAIYDVLYTRRCTDPTIAIDPSPSNATTYNNPGFKEGRRTNGVSMTDSSGKPYHGITNGGSVASMNTTVTSVSNGSTVDSSVVRSPLRSSLKKPRPKDGLGIQNPGFSGNGTSPQMNRNGSVKKVRIQTHSTEV